MTDIRDQWLAEIAAAADESALRELESRLLGKSGAVTELLKNVPKLPPEERRAAGQAAHQAKVAIEAALAGRRAALDAAALARELDGGGFDPSAPALRRGSGSGPTREVLVPWTRPRGTLHPITVVRDELVDLFRSLGFAWLDGPEVESEFFNFEALNIPADHPARDSQDTFWLDDGNLLRTHTSPVQIRAMRHYRPPLKVIVPGRCFRSETVDKSHEHTFYQMEGLVVDEGVSTANLIHTMKTCLRVVLRRDVKVRLRPGFFPFVEPGFELDVNCPFCNGAGCSVCKQSGWIEILPCGMVHPRVLEAGGVDPERYTGFAFGMGLQRVTMLRYGVDDIRLFTGCDLRFLSQFGEVAE
ncbi:MAG: phenylalanine--tRNA ligase subunit alpha [Planctomycetes bacterium]|nr:phenylalanine--tRNA ligase subunit alpha [Planctomycetota bacterium]